MNLEPNTTCPLVKKFFLPKSQVLQKNLQDFGQSGTSGARQEKYSLQTCGKALGLQSR